MLHVAPGRHRVTTGGFVIDHSNIMSSNLGSVHLHLRLPQPYLSFLTEIQISHRINTNRIILKAKLPTAVKKICLCNSYLYYNLAPLSHQGKLFYSESSFSFNFNFSFIETEVFCILRNVLRLLTLITQPTAGKVC